MSFDLIRSGGLLVDPRDDRRPDGRVEREALRLGPPLEVPPDAGRESNGPRNRRARLGALPWPAPANVDRDPLRGHAERVRIATDLRLVEVHLGDLAHRGTGWLASLLTSRTL